MKKITFLLAFFLVNCFISFGQAFYKSAAKDDFESLMKNGVTYILTGDADKDDYCLKAIKKVWTVTPVRVFDPNSDNNNFVINKDDIIFIDAQLNSSDHILD